MRKIASYLLAGTLMVLVTDFIVLPVGFGLAVRARPASEPGTTTQHVDRTLKGDRLNLPTAVGMQPALGSMPAVLIGCDPPYSPLLSTARAQGPGRCIS